MHKVNFSRILPFIVFIAIFSFHLFSFNQLPPAFPDDGLTAGRTKAFLDSGFAVAQMEAAILDRIPNGNYLNNTLPYYLYALPVLISGEISLESIRTVNLFLIALSLILVFLISKEIKDWKFGLISMIILGFSNNFTYAGHIARPDFIASVVGLLGIFIFLRNKNSNFWVDIFLGLTITVGFILHPRIVIYIPILCLLYLNKYQWGIFRSWNFWSFFGALGCSSLAYYVLRILPYQASFAELNLAVVAGSRSLPILSFDYQQIQDSILRVLGQLYFDHFLYAAGAVGLFLSLFSRDQACRVMIVLTLGTLLVTASVMSDFYIFNSIIIVGLASISVAFCCYLVFSFDRYLIFSIIGKLVVILLIGHYVLTNAEKSALRVGKNQICVQEIQQFNSVLKTLIKPEDTIVGEEDYWFKYQQNKFHSWKNLNYIRRLENYSLEEAMLELKPNYFILNSAIGYFITDEVSPSPWVENLRISAKEFYAVMDKHFQMEHLQINRCNQNLVLYKFKNQDTLEGLLEK